MKRALWRRLTSGHLFAHFVLLAGCVLFGFPFFWLLSTSMKESREVFSDPPQWLPGLPLAPERSPYVAADEFRPPQPGVELDGRIWSRQWPQLRRQLWQAARVRLQRVGVQTAEAASVAMPRGLWQRVTAGLPDATVRRLILHPEEAPQHLSQEACTTVWERVRKQLLVRLPTLQDVAYQTFTPDSGAWTSASSQVVSLERISAPDEKATWLVRYNFARGEVGRLRFECPLPRAADGRMVTADRFLRLTVPAQFDRSFHRLDVRIDVGGTVYRPERPWLLDTDLWQEAAWQVKAEGEQSTLFRDYIPLLPEGKSGTASDRLVVTLLLIRNSRLQAAWDKGLRNYRAALQYMPMTRYLWNTLLLVVLTVMGELVSCSLVAYSFARLRWPGRDILFAILLATMMLPGQVTMIPVFLIYKHLGWYNTLQPLWFNSLFGSAFFIFMLRQFMRTIPTELEEAARIDGCGFFGCYWRVILPLMKPALAAVAIFTFMNTWNNFMGPLIYLNDQRLYPLSLGLFQFRLEHSTDFGMLMAASTLMTLPVVAVFFFAQRHFIQGITLTGMKG